jgi:predicted  nucleic acid-binding Zn-ribbon protein
MHEVINQTIREIRENSKFSSSQRTELEEYYKKFREDLGEVSQSMKSEAASANDDGQIVDSKKLNDLITEAMKNKKPKT